MENLKNPNIIGIITTIITFVLLSRRQTNRKSNTESKKSTERSKLYIVVVSLIMGGVAWCLSHYFLYGKFPNFGSRFASNQPLNMTGGNKNSSHLSVLMSMAPF